MKKWLAALSVVLLVCSIVYAMEKEAADTDKDKKPKVESICPVTKISDNNKCLDCHAVAMREGVPKWIVKECDPQKEFSYPVYNFSFIEEKGQRVGRLFLPEIDSTSVEKTFAYLSRHPEIKKLIIEIHNPGGSMMSMWRIVGLMDEFKRAGGIVETRCHGFAASAAFIVLVNGSKGYRFVDPTALLMWHEVMSFSFFNMSTPSSSEEEAKTMRKFQNTAHCWLASRCNLTKEQIDEKVAKKEWWMDGKEAVEAGFADGLIK